MRVPANLKSSPYGFSPSEYLIRCKSNVELHNQTQNKAYLFYAALELRFTIESVMFYYLWILNKKRLTKSQQKLWHAQDLKREILEIDPLFPYRLDFIALAAYLGGDLDKTVKPDFGLLTKSWAKLGNYLHSQKHPLSNKLPEDFWVEFSEILQAPCENLALVLSNPLVDLEFTQKGMDIIKLYASGQMSWVDVKDTFFKNWNTIFHCVTQYIHDI